MMPTYQQERKPLQEVSQAHPKRRLADVRARAPLASAHAVAHSWANEFTIEEL